jgi:glycosyltransferase involved in cell wall biosynthesis
MGKPVVASRLPLIEQTFPADSVYAYEPGSASAMAEAIIRLADDSAERLARVERTSRIVRETSWEVASRPYLQLVGQLTGSG